MDAARMDRAGWRASLDLGFELREGRTVLARRAHHGPLVVQKPFYPEGPGRCHVYVVHPPAGVAGGDVLELAIRAGAGARALATTPGAAKLYRTDGSAARVVQRFTVERDAVLEWLPQETIAHSGTQARLETVVDLAPGALFAGWEIACLGLPASGAPFAAGRFSQGLRIERAGRPLLAERCLHQGGAAMLDAPWGLGGATVTGVFAATLDAGVEERSGLSPFSGADPWPDDAAPLSPNTGAGIVDGLLLARYLGRDAWEAKRDFAALWAAWRQRTQGAHACPPRIWNT